MSEKIKKAGRDTKKSPPAFHFSLDPNKNLISIKAAELKNFCRRCNFAGRLKFQDKPCNYHKHGKALNYRNIPAGMCALRVDDRDRMATDYGTNRQGGIR